MKHLTPMILYLIGQIAAQEFPPEFQFGVATASYQVEGAWNISGKGENIWDWITHNNPNFISDNSNGDIACDAYHKTIEDVRLLKDINVNFYRFSISWARILPTGQVNNINDDGIRYYNELIDELLANNITPLVTMYHWDLPTALHELGGWPNPLLADIFLHYADKLFSLFGDRVKNWITFNEPYQICDFGYSHGILAPGYVQRGNGGYLCGHTVLIAHGKTYKRYQEIYKSRQGGKVGISIHGAWYEPETNSDEDRKAAENSLQATFGWYAHPIYIGDYPPIMRERIDRLSEEQQFRRSRLPSFTAEEIDLIKGSSDFLGINHYTSFICTPRKDGVDEVFPTTTDVDASCYQLEEWPVGASRWLRVVPWGLRNFLNWVKEQYDNPEVMITENGFSDESSDLRDCERVEYYNSYLTAVLEAIHEDNCNVTAYTAWSFMDNFEWVNGYSERFGIHYVDFDDENRPRTAKMSAYVYKNIIDTRRIDHNYVPEGFERCGAVVIILSKLNTIFLILFVSGYLL